MPVISIPEDVLRHIFLVGSDEDNLTSSYLYLHTLNFPTTISHICRYWRLIALDTAQLWTTLHFNESTNLDRILTWLSRTKSAKLDIEINLSHASLWEMLSEAVSILLPHISRWRSFHADAYSAEYIEYFLGHCTGHSSRAESLESLVLRCRQRKGLKVVQNGPFFGGHTPQLRHLHFTRVTVPWSQSIFNGLTSLTLFSPSADDAGPNPSHFISILNSCPNLHSMYLTNFNLSPPHTVDIPCIPLPHLRRLELRSSVPNGVHRSVLDLVHPEALKGLTTLIIVVNSGGFWFREHHSITMDQSLSLLEKTPSLEHCEFSFILPQDKITRPTRRIHLPFLHHLILRSESSSIDVGPLLDHIHAPSLTHLGCIVLPPIIRAKTWPFLFNFLQHSRPPLHSLQIHGIYVIESNFTDSLELVPDLHEISLESSSADDDVLQALTPRRLCPALNSLFFKNCDDFTGLHLRTLVHARSTGASACLSTLIVNYCQGVKMADLAALHHMADSNGFKALLTGWTGDHAFSQSMYDGESELRRGRESSVQWIGVGSTYSLPKPR